MKVLAICGSPRKGNTETMLMKILKGAEAGGAETELVLLRKLNIRHCDGCLSCEKTGRCRIQDDMQGLCPKMEKADILAFGSPNYYENVTGLFKDFIDRTNPFYIKGNRKLGGKPAALVAVGDISIDDAIQALKGFCKAHSIKVKWEIGTKAVRPGDASKDSKKMQECFELGQGMAKA